jgi:pSer/pThr/pTyr-binding forkhead associated (FHA) protein
MAAPVAPRRAPVTVTIDSGEEAVIQRLLIIGRAPSRRDGESHAEMLAVNDPSLSVSKTHLAIEVDGDGLWVVDRNSTNGTWIDEGRGALRPVPAGQRTRVPPGARVLIGERVLTFTRPS